MYQQVFLTSVLDIPEQIGLFADLVGWNVDLSNVQQPILTHPSFVGALPIRVRAAITGTNNQNRDLIFEVQNPVATSTAITRSPKLAGTANNPTVPAPTSIHLFGDITNPFIACVVEYGNNLYRHSYLGYVDKTFNYNGGEIIAGSAGPDSTTAANVFYAEDLVKYLFTGKSSVFPANTSGGMHLNHPNSAIAWYQNRIPLTGNGFASFTNNMVLGGYRDGFNDPYAARGQSSYAGAAVLTPINMFIGQPITGDVRFIPVGNPHGVRLVNVRNLANGQVLNIGGELWRVFPAISKRPETQMPLGGGNYRQFETSFEVGYAYKEN
jgi:hypothetical protein